MNCNPIPNDPNNIPTLSGTLQPLQLPPISKESRTHLHFSKKKISVQKKKQSLIKKSPKNNCTRSWLLISRSSTSVKKHPIHIQKKCLWNIDGWMNEKDSSSTTSHERNLFLCVFLFHFRNNIFFLNLYIFFLNTKYFPLFCLSTDELTDSPTDWLT